MSEGPFGRRREPAPPREEPEPPRHRPGPPRPPAGIASNATWIAAAVIALVLIYVTINTLRTDSNGSRGVPIGQRIPPFAAPLALADAKCSGGEECDANVQTRARKGIPAACDVHGPNVLNSCELTRRPLVLAFLVAPSQKCIDQIDLLDRLRGRFPDVQFAAVAIRGDHGDLNAIIRRHGWKLPVAYDHDGAIANAFAVAICPTITFARRGGEVVDTTLGTASEQEIVADIRSVRSIHPRGTP
jgi:hypothetical protein